MIDLEQPRKYLVTLHKVQWSFRHSVILIDPCLGLQGLSLCQWRRCFFLWRRIHEPSSNWWCDNLPARSMLLASTQDQMVRPTSDHLAETKFHPAPSSNQLVAFPLSLLRNSNCCEVFPSLEIRKVESDQFIDQATLQVMMVSVGGLEIRFKTL